MNENELLIERTVSNLKDLVDAVIGKSIQVGNNGVVIPVSRVTVGVVSGSGNGDKNKKGVSEGFGGGAGGSVAPIGFLMVGNGVCKFVNVGKEEDNKWLNFINSAMDIIKPSK